MSEAVPSTPVKTTAPALALTLAFLLSLLTACSNDAPTAPPSPGTDGSRLVEEVDSGDPDIPEAATNGQVVVGPQQAGRGGGGDEAGQACEDGDPGGVE
jgi:hypothetical protein